MVCMKFKFCLLRFMAFKFVAFCLSSIRLSQVGDFRLCSLQPRRRRRRRSVHGGHLLHGRIDATARYGYLELAIEQMAKTADASNALNHGLHYLRSTGNACAARVLLWWGWENSDAHAGRHDNSSPSDASRLFDEMCEKQNRDINGVFMCLIQIYF
ncbi:hypothetical protein ZEAMMB73_Zm00001d004083, partial [Zea mays]